METGKHIDPKRFEYLIGALYNGKEGINTFIHAGKENGLRVFPIPEKGSKDVSVLTKILTIAKTNKVNLIHTHEVRTDIIGLVCAKILNIPIITTVHGWIDNDVKGKLLIKLDKIILRYFNHIIAVNREIKETLVSNKIEKERITVLHNALVIDNFEKKCGNRTFRKEMGLKENHIVIGNIGRLSPEKGQGDFLEAVKQVLDKGYRCEFVIIGKGSDEKKLKRLVNKNGTENHVVFAGFREDISSIYDSLDLVIQSSYTEGLPNVVLEALAKEVPVIATNVGGTSEIIENGVTGILISPKNPEEMAREIINFLKDPNKMMDMTRFGREKVRKEFDFRQRTEKLETIYEALLDRRTT